MSSADVYDVDRIQELQQRLAAHARRAGIQVPELVVGRCAGVARARSRRGRSSVTVDPELLGAPNVVVGAFLAHEVGQLALGHAARRVWFRRTLTADAYPITGIPLLVAAFGRPPVVAPWAGPAIGAYGLIVALSLALAAKGSRAWELAADRFGASTLGSPLGPDAAAWVGARESAAMRPPGWLAWLRTHPTWPDRIDAVAGFVRQES